jgi:hypothetical protein
LHGLKKRIRTRGKAERVSHGRVDLLG